MTSQPHHRMHLKVYETGAHEWLCPTCGRQVVMQARRPYIVLVEGDTCALHTGASGGVEIGSVEVVRDEPIPDEFQDWIDRQGS